VVRDESCKQDAWETECWHTAPSSYNVSTSSAVVFVAHATDEVLVIFCTCGSCPRWVPPEALGSREGREQHGMIGDGRSSDVRDDAGAPGTGLSPPLAPSPLPVCPRLFSTAKLSWFRTLARGAAPLCSHRCVSAVMDNNGCVAGWLAGYMYAGLLAAQRCCVPPCLLAGCWLLCAAAAPAGRCCFETHTMPLPRLAAAATMA
jgi:hypothetical protein